MRKVVAGYAIYVAVFGALAVVRWKVWSYGADAGTFTQVVLDAFGGFHDGPEDGTHFRFHWAPMLATLYPFVAPFRSALALEFAQIALIGATAFPLYALARRYAGERLAWRCAIVALIYPPLVGVVFLEFHEIAFFPVLVIALVWAADAERWTLFALFGFLSLMVREEACAVMFCAGVLLALCSVRPALWRAPRRGLLYLEPATPRALAVAGVSLAIAAAAVLGFYFGIVIPHVGSWQPSRFYEYPFAHGPLGVLVAVFLQPGVAVPALFTLGRLTYLLEAFTPLAFLPLRSAWTLAAVPGLVVILLSSDGITWRMGSHYAGTWIPWLFVAVTAVLCARARDAGAEAGLVRFRWVAAGCALFLIAFNPTHAGHYLRAPYADTADAQRALASLPPDAAVLTHDEWFTHIAGRDPRATIFFRPDTEYIVVANDYPSDAFQQLLRPLLAREVAAHRFTIVGQYGQVVVYKRVAPDIPELRDPRWGPVGFVTDPGSRHSQAAPSVNSTTASAIASRGPSPGWCASASVTSGPVSSGAMTCGRAAATFHMPIADAIAPAGRIVHASAQSAVKNAPHAAPASAAAA